MGIGNSRLSPCGGVHNYTTADFIVLARRSNRDISRFIFSTLERQLFDVDNYIFGTKFTRITCCMLLYIKNDIYGHFLRTRRKKLKIFTQKSF